MGPMICANSWNRIRKAWVGLTGFVLLAAAQPAMSFEAGSLLDVRRCTKANDQDSAVFTYEPGQSIDAFGQDFDEMYSYYKRLPRRVYFDTQKKQYVIALTLWVKRGGNSRDETHTVVVPIRFIQNVVDHIEISLRRRYAHYIFMPDMGHGHFLVPEQYGEGLDGQGKLSYYNEILPNPSTKILYHTAEDIDLPGPDLNLDEIARIWQGFMQKIEGDEGSSLSHRYNWENFNRIVSDAAIKELYRMSLSLRIPSTDEEVEKEKLLLWRYLSRNVVGDNDAGEVEVHTVFEIPDYASYRRRNTLRSVPGYIKIQAAIRIRATVSGCFSYQHQGQTYYFDLVIY
ncbi:MAG: hypothetical protein V3W08_10875 [Candidatus Binatia bacterium]